MIRFDEKILRIASIKGIQVPDERAMEYLNGVVNTRLENLGILDDTILAALRSFKNLLEDENRVVLEYKDKSDDSCHNSPFVTLSEAYEWANFCKTDIEVLDVRVGKESVMFMFRELQHALIV